MTANRDFKRRVRLRQARTGESYVTARRHLLATRPSSASHDDLEATLPGGLGAAALAIAPDRPDRPEPAGPPAAPVTAAGAPGGGDRGAGGGGGDGDDAGNGGGGDGSRDGGESPTGISVVELVDVTEEARGAGLLCRAVMFPALVERIAPARVLSRLRDVLIATAGDPETARLSRLALTGQIPPRRHRDDVRSIEALQRLLQRARAGLSATLGDGATLAFHVAEAGELVPIMCTLSARETWIELSLIGGPLPERWAPFASVMAPLSAELGDAGRRRELAAVLSGELTRATWPLVPHRMPEPTLHVVYAGRRQAVTREPFVIGHNAEVCDLVLDDREVSAEHAAVIVRNRTYYLKDLGSSNGVHYKGMQIDNKRITEGDVFEIAGHQLRFTYLDG